jgi:hypothetical protein
MKVRLGVDAERGLLTVTYSGDFSLAEAEGTFLDLLDTLVEHNLRKVLIDGRQLAGNPELLERFYYGAFVAAAVNRTVNRTRCAVPAFAYVLEIPVLDPNRFGETVAVNRGMRVKAFDNLQQARWWLGLTVDTVDDETKADN